jgi:hypothetical protein
VVVVVRVDELIEEFDPLFVQRLREELRQMFIAHGILPDPSV